MATATEPRRETLPAKPAFPAATKIDPIYAIDGRWCRKVTNAEGQSDPSAIRAMLDAVRDGKPAKVVAWFVPLDVPKSNEELSA